MLKKCSVWFILIREHIFIKIRCSLLHQFCFYEWEFLEEGRTNIRVANRSLVNFLLLLRMFLLRKRDLVCDIQNVLFFLNQ